MFGIWQTAVLAYQIFIFSKNIAGETRSNFLAARTNRTHSFRNVVFRPCHNCVANTYTNKMERFLYFLILIMPRQSFSIVSYSHLGLLFWFPPSQVLTNGSGWSRDDSFRRHCNLKNGTSTISETPDFVSWSTLSK